MIGMFSFVSIFLFIFYFFTVFGLLIGKETPRIGVSYRILLKNTFWNFYTSSSFIFFTFFYWIGTFYVYNLILFFRILLPFLEDDRDKFFPFEHLESLDWADSFDLEQFETYESFSFLLE